MPNDAHELTRATNQDLATMPFHDALEAYTPNLASVLPEHIPLDRFKRVVLTAVNITPELGGADRRSLFNACAKCAHDGLYPDGREAALVVFRTKVKRREKLDNGRVVEREYYAELVQYLPMIAGIRKRMRNTGEVLSADAQIVCRGDKFHYEFGDDPRIVHEPPPLGAERGDTIGAYAVIKLANGEVLREVMGRPEIERVRAFSRSGTGARSPWTTSWDEMARKTVLRRCSKAAPTGSDIERLLGRDEELPTVQAHTQLREVPPRPQREDFMISNGSEAENEETDAGEDHQAQIAFEVVDLDGVVHEHREAGHAREALAALIEQAKSRGRAAVEGIWESNYETVLEIGEVVEDEGESLRQAYAEAIASFETGKTQPDPGNRQDRPREVATPTPNPPEGATTTAASAAFNPLPKDPPASLTVPLAQYKAEGKRTDWDGMTQAMVALIKTLTDPADTAAQGRFNRDNRDGLELMRTGNRPSWSTVNYELGERDRELREGTGRRQAR